MKCDSSGIIIIKKVSNIVEDMEIAGSWHVFIFPTMFPMRSVSSRWVMVAENNVINTYDLLVKYRNNAIIVELV